MRKTFSAILSDLLNAYGRFDEGRDVWAKHDHARFRAWLLEGLNEVQCGALDRDVDTVGSWERLCTTIFGDKRTALDEWMKRAVKPKAGREPENTAPKPDWIAMQAHMQFSTAAL